jgi:hypothetical protein
MTSESINLGQWTIDNFNKLLLKAAMTGGAGERIAFLSGHFHGIPYLENTLVGGVNTNEVFVVNLASVDCYTFIDYIEAMRLSSSFDDFMEFLKKIRYRGGIVSFRDRNHFFTDWREFNGEFVEDATGKIGLQDTRTVRKVLNLREDGSFFIPRVGSVERDVRYIPSSLLNDQIINRIETGDYVGMYSDCEGLDVTHVGIFIKQGKSLFLRHASSARENRKVVDQDFIEYVKNKPGIVVFRPKE